jgi:hypothetical protein
LQGGTDVNGAVHASVSPVVVTPLAFKPVGALSTPEQLSVDEFDDELLVDEADEGVLLDEGALLNDDEDLTEEAVELEVVTDEEVETEDADLLEALEVVKAELEDLTDELDDAIIEDEEPTVPALPNT